MHVKCGQIKQFKYLDQIKSVFRQSQKRDNGSIDIAYVLSNLLPGKP
jgi:hypothetical protein